ncbi:MAG: hypothetical protein JWN50_661 [Parcubacteria group bacterium]|nr:hypothetical protein [Parcubacteria group bacterium]
MREYLAKAKKLMVQDFRVKRVDVLISYVR